MSKQIRRILSALLMLAIMLGSTPLAVLAEAPEAAAPAATETPEAGEIPAIDEVGDDYGTMPLAPDADATQRPAATATVSPSASATAAPTATPACSHSWGEWTDMGQIECGDSGFQIRYCRYCSINETRPVTREHEYSIPVSVDVEPNCKTNTPGRGQYACKYCWDIMFIQIPARHDYSVLVKTISQATCEKTGRAVFACSKCSRQIEQDTEKTDHLMLATTVHEKATCTKAGKEDQRCKYCALTRSKVTVPALGHNYGASQREPASCEYGGRIYEKCSRCGDIHVLADLGTQPLGHSYGAAQQLPADCTHPSRVAQVCSRCGDEKDAKTEGKALGHKYEYEIIRESSCEEEGIVLITCSRCDYEARQESPKEAHTSAVRSTPASCTAPEYREEYCSVCSAVLKRETVGKALGHTPQYETIGGTCQKPGTVRSTCKVCKEVLSETSTGTTEAHNVKLERVYEEATCARRGSGIYKCEWCEYRIKKDIEKLEHDYTERVTQVSCTEDGMIEIVCSMCGDVKSSVTTDVAKGHQFKAVEVLVQGNCLTNGVEHWVCEVCQYDADNVIIYATGHNFEEITVKAGCTEQGYRGVFCTKCNEQQGKILEYFPATGHHFETVAAVEPTCTEKGYTDGERCSGCDLVKRAPEEIPAKGHKEKKIERVEPKCEVVGYTEGVGCSECDAILTAPQEIPALEHRERTLKPVEPTCTKTGLGEGSACALCHKVFAEQQIIPATGHDLEIVFGKEPSCTEAGLTLGERCLVCKEMVVPQESIPALGHTVVVDKGFAATCQKSGMTDGSHCSVCNAVLQERKVIPVLEHDWEISPESSRYYICSGCGREASSRPSSVEIDMESGVVLAPGESLSLSVRYSPEDSYSPLSWKSSNSRIVAVDSRGNLEAIGEGTATISVRTDNKKTDSLKVKVVDPTKPIGIRLNHSSTIILGVGEEIELFAELYPETAESELTWASKKPKIARVEDGVVTGLTKGSALIGVWTENGLMDTVKVTVVDPDVAYAVAIDPGEDVVLELGEELQLSFEILPASADVETRWKSSRKSIAEVDESGLVTAVGEGTATITIETRNGKKDTMKVKVVDPSKPTKVELNETGTVNLEVGETLELYATLYPDTAESEISWRSNRKKVAEVDEDGVVTAIAPGSAVISAITENGKTGSVRVRVS